MSRLPISRSSRAAQGSRCSPFPGLVVFGALAAAACGGSASPAPNAPAGARSDTPSPASRTANSRAEQRALVAIEDADQVVVLSGHRRWQVLRRVRMPAGPHNVTASARLGLVAVTSPPADRVTVLDGAGRIVARAKVAGAPHDAVFVPDRRIAWVSAEAAGRIVALDPRTGRTVGSVTTGGPPHDLAVSPDGRRLWVTIDGRPAVEVRDALSGRLRGARRLGGAPHDLAFAPGGRRVWLSNFGSALLTVASAGGRRIGSLRAGTEPHHFAFGFGRLWASDNGSGTLLRIEPVSRRVAGRTRVGAAPHHVAVGDDAVLVALQGTGRVAVVGRSGRLRARVAVGRGPHGIDIVRFREPS